MPALRGDGERFAGRRRVAGQERADGLPDAGSVRVGHEQTHVIPEILERILLLQKATSASARMAARPGLNALMVSVRT